MKKALKIVLTIFLCLVLLSVVAAVSALVIQDQRTKRIDTDYACVFDNEKYAQPVSVDGVEVIKQDVSCGYAVIEMFSTWCGSDVTEKTLYDEYGRVVTSTGKCFCEEMNKRFPQYETTMYKYLTNDELIDKVYVSLENDMPVPVEWAALCDGEWTLHYSLITGMDIPNDKVTVANPYGYYEEITVEEFLSRTRFEAYEDMPIFLKLGFAIGIFEENTVYIVN